MSAAPGSGPGRFIWLPQATVFVSSACIMVLELVAGRVISRHLGSSLYTWTSVIGIVLAGIALGNWIGGRLADRYRPLPTLSSVFLASSVLCLGISILNNTAGQWTFLWTLPWPVRVGTHVAIVFLAPSVALGMISPVAAKMALDRSTQTGRTLGSVYAWGVIGSIAGTFAAGFYLIAAFGIASVVWAVAITLAVMAILFGTASWRAWSWAAAITMFTILGTAPWAWARSLGESLCLRETTGAEVLFRRDSQYSHIEVLRVAGEGDRRMMMLDKLVHSEIDMERPSDLRYGYARVYAAITRELARGKDHLATLTIGGGGLVFPRYAQDMWPGSRTDVVEIDPEVTEAAIVAMGLPPDHPLRVFHEDGRSFLARRAEDLRKGRTSDRYDVVYMDAVNDYSVPFQLTTRECFSLVHDLLGGDGAFVMNMIDVYEEGHLLGALLATIGDVFDHVDVFVEGRWSRRPEGARDTFILVGSDAPLDGDRIVREYHAGWGLHRMSATDLAPVRERNRGRVLTDDWAPVENMLAPVVRRSSRELAASLLSVRAETAFRHKDLDAAKRAAEKVLKFSPRDASAHVTLGNVAFVQGQTGKALRSYEAALKARPDWAQAQSNYGAALLKAGRVGEAVFAFEEALRLEPDNAKAAENLARARAMAAANGAAGPRTDGAADPRTD